MIRRPAGCFGSNPIKAELAQIELVHEHVNHSNWIVLVNPVLKAVREQRALPAVRSLNEALHPILPEQNQCSENLMKQPVFTQPGSFTTGPPDERCFQANVKMPAGKDRRPTGQPEAPERRVEPKRHLAGSWRRGVKLVQVPWSKR
jgi:hypothetical protein